MSANKCSIAAVNATGYFTNAWQQSLTLMDSVCAVRTNACVTALIISHTKSCLINRPHMGKRYKLSDAIGIVVLVVVKLFVASSKHFWKYIHFGLL